MLCLPILVKTGQRDLNHLAKILEEPYHAANNSFNIVSGFRKLGLYLPNFQWLDQNQETFKLLMISRREARFEELCERAQKADSKEKTIDRLQYLDLGPLSLISQNESEIVPELRRSLSSLLTTTKKHLTKDKKVQIRTNILGEDPSMPRILNEPERLEVLEVEKRKREEEKKKEDQKNVRRTKIKSREFIEKKFSIFTFFVFFSFNFARRGCLSGCRKFS